MKYQTMPPNILPALKHDQQSQNVQQTQAVSKRVNNGKVETFAETATGQSDAMSVLNPFKPVLWRNCLHMGNNVIVTWRSIEINIV